MTLANWMQKRLFHFCVKVCKVSIGLKLGMVASYLVCKSIDCLLSFKQVQGICIRSVFVFVKGLGWEKLHVFLDISHCTVSLFYVLQPKPVNDFA